MDLQYLYFHNYVYSIITVDMSTVKLICMHRMHATDSSGLVKGFSRAIFNGVAASLVHIVQCDYAFPWRHTLLTS